MIADLRDRVLSGEPLADLLRRSLVLGGAAGSEPLREWARQELRGYTKDDTLPPYRVLSAQLLMDYISGRFDAKAQLVPLGGFDDDMYEQLTTVPIRFPVGELEVLAASGEAVDLAPGIGPYVAAQIAKRQPYPTVTRVYFTLGAAAIAGVVDQVRTTLTELVVELAASTPEDQVPTAEAADRALSIAIHGGQVGQVVVQHTGGGSADGFTAIAPEVQIQEFTADQVAALTKLLPDLRRLVEDAPEEQRAHAEAQVATIEAQVGSGRPVRAVVRHAGLALEQVLYGVGGSATFEVLRRLVS